MFHGKLPQHARTATVLQRARACERARTRGRGHALMTHPVNPRSFGSHCTCARDNIYQAPVLLVGGPGNEATIMMRMHHIVGRA